MSGAEKIQERILADAKAIQDKALSDAGQEAQNIIENAEKEAFQKITILTERAREEATKIKQRGRADEQMENRKRTLKARQDSIQGAFNRALEQLSNLPDDQYRLFLKRLILDSAKDEKGTITFNDRDKGNLGEAFVSEINADLKAKRGSANLSLSQDVLNSCGGFVLKYGDMEINSTLEIILNMIRPELESEVASILFSIK